MLSEYHGPRPDGAADSGDRERGSSLARPQPGAAPPRWRPWGDRGLGRPRGRDRRAHRFGRADLYFDHDRTEDAHGARSYVESGSDVVPEVMYGEPEARPARAPEPYDASRACGRNRDDRAAEWDEAKSLPGVPAEGARFAPRAEAESDLSLLARTAASDAARTEVLAAGVPPPAEPSIKSEVPSASAAMLTEMSTVAERPVESTAEADAPPAKTAPIELPEMSAQPAGPYEDPSEKAAMPEAPEMPTEQSRAEASTASVDTHCATSAAPPDLPQALDAPAEAPNDTQGSREAHELAQKLAAQYPWTAAHEHACLGANRAVAASLAVPASLGSVKTGAGPVPCDAAAARVMPALAASLEAQAAARVAKVDALRAEYRERHRAWKEYCEELDRLYERREQQRAAPAEDASAAPAPPRSYRRGAPGSGDAVHSEAEFLEILASLENAEMQDPVVRAARTSATVPDMNITSGARATLDVDNGYVADSARFYFGGFDPDVWSEEERAIFARRYAQYPKQFGRIAEKLPHKSMQQCVAYYYLHKHDPDSDFKANSTRHRERRRKSKSRPKKAKGSALMADVAAAQEEPAGAEESPVGDAAGGAAPDKAERAPKRAKAPKRHEDPAFEADLAAAEALEALAGVVVPKKKKTRRDDAEPRSRSRGPHWSMSERGEFLRLLALYGKDWNALAAAFPAKTSAQTRNFFARHASESSHFQAAAALAAEQAELPWETRVAAADAFVRDWYASLPDGAAKASITGWPAAGATTPPPPPPSGPVAPEDAAPADETEAGAAAAAPASADDDATDDEVPRSAEPAWPTYYPPAPAATAPPYPVRHSYAAERDAAEAAGLERARESYAAMYARGEYAAGVAHAPEAPTYVREVPYRETYTRSDVYRPAPAYAAEVPYARPAAPYTMEAAPYRPPYAEAAYVRYDDAYAARMPMRYAPHMGYFARPDRWHR